MSAWHDLVTASLIGTERSAVPVVAIPGLPPVGDEPGDPAAVLLDRAALLTAARRAGRQPGRAEPLPACEPDPRVMVNPAAAARLARMLGGEYPDLLAEWLTAVIARGLRPPPQSLPDLLDRARRAGPADAGLARLVTEAGGPRARWLAGLNPDWKPVAAPARDLVRGRWPEADPAGRVMFLSVRADRLGPADEPLLEAALDDRAEEVRRWAAYLLARLAGSALGRRMAERALRCVRLERGARLAVVPPAECDASMRHDGITPGPAAVRAQLAERSRLMLEVVARTPLRTWTDAFGRTAAQVTAVPSGDWAPVLFTGWARAAIAQRDHDWMAALISRALTGRPPGTAAEFEALRQLARRAEPALGAPGTLPEPRPDAPPVVGAALRVLRFRYDMGKELDDDFDKG